MKSLFKIFSFIITLVGLSSCEFNDPDATFSYEHGFMRKGDIVVVSSTSDAAILLDEDGNYKELLLDLPNATEQVLGLGWNPTTNEVVLGINGTPDRVVAISAYTGEIREVVRNSQLNGNIRGVTVLSDGSYLVVESNNVEKFSASGARVTAGSFPLTNLQTNGTQISALSNGGFLLCSYGTDRVRTYTAAGVQVNETASGIGGTTNSYGCKESSDGNIAASWDGTTDSVVMYNSTLGSAVWSFSDTTLFNAPRGIEVKSNGNVLVADSGFDLIVEIDSEGEFVRTLASALVADPWQLLEIPEY